MRRQHAGPRRGPLPPHVALPLDQAEIRLHAVPWKSDAHMHVRQGHRQDLLRQLELHNRLRQGVQGLDFKRVLYNQK